MTISVKVAVTRHARTYDASWFSATATSTASAETNQEAYKLAYNEASLKATNQAENNATLHDRKNAKYSTMTGKTTSRNPLLVGYKGLTGYSLLSSKFVGYTGWTDTLELKVT